MLNSFFALGLSEHRLWGLLLIPLKIKRTVGEVFYQPGFTIFPSENDENYQKLSFSEKEVVKIIDEYSDKNLFKLFSKNKTIKEFQEKVDRERIDKFIKPYIEKRLYRIFDLIKDTDIKVFLRDRTRSNIFQEDFLTIEKEPVVPVFSFVKSEEESRYSLQLKYKGKDLMVKGKACDIISNVPALLRVGNRVYFLKDIEAIKIKPFFNKDYITIPPKTILTYFKKFVLNMVRNFEVNAEGFSIIETAPEKKVFISLERGIDSNAKLVLQFQYGNKIVNANSTQKCFVNFSHKNDEFVYEKFYRDHEFEEYKHELISDLGLISFDQVNFEQKGARTLSFGEQVNNLVVWLNENSSDLEEQMIGVIQKNEFEKYYTGSYELSITTKRNIDWFDIHAIIQLENAEIPFYALRRNILNKEREYILKDGSVFIIPLEWFSRFREMFEFGKIEKDVVKIHKQHFFIVEKAKEKKSGKLLEGLELLNRRESLPGIKLPSGLTADLREYQQEGYKWLCYLRQNKLGGCLADDMGLGKTLQAISVLQKSKEELSVNPEKKEQRSQLDLFSQLEPESPSSMIVVPASLLHNWKNEIARFAPAMKVYVHAGTQRRRNTDSFASFDVIVSSYHTVRQDVEMLMNFSFHYLILDESQVIKNPSSKVYKAVNMLNAEHKLALTGTPVENSLIDLWAQMNFINVGLLGTLNFFKKVYVIPIERKNHKKKEEELKKLINPFILRRKKEEVARELPSLNQQQIVCSMTDEQKKVYEEEKSGIRNMIFERIENQGMEKSTIIVLQALTRLRQISNHPCLVDRNYSGDSGKFTEVMRNIENVVSEGHKVLVFSSFVRHLRLFAAEFDQKAISYSMLTGMSRNREKIVSEFQEDESRKVFLISLKAGGVGLNLTAADYVFILDPWWNPAAEDQALNRAHRIGQDKNVFVYRFISENSIEEKIRQLQERKSKLAETFVTSNNPLKEIGEKELEELFF